MITEAQAVDLPRAALPRYPTPMWSIVWVIFWIARSPTAVLVIAAWFIDEAFFGFRAAALRRWRASRRARNLEDLLAHNPHDRRARFELADLLVARGRYQRAVDVLKPNLEAGDHDPATLLSMATACFGAGYPAQAEVFIAEARAQDPTHGFGALDLELGRGRLRSGDAGGAKEPLDHLIALRPGTIGGRVLLARVLARAGQGGDARRTLAEAFRAWRHAPRFVRRRDRTWMWRARPLVGAAQLGLALAVALLAAAIVPRVAIRGIGGIESAEATEMPEPEQEADRREAPQGPESEPEAPAARATRSR